MISRPYKYVCGYVCVGMWVCVHYCVPYTRVSEVLRNTEVIGEGHSLYTPLFI